MAAQLALTFPGSLVAAGGKQPCAVPHSIFKQLPQSRRGGRERRRLQASVFGEKGLTARLAPALAG